MLDKTSSIICAFGLAAAAPRSPYRHLELCGIALTETPGAIWRPVFCFAANQTFLFHQNSRRDPCLKGGACCCGCMLQEREMQENLNDNCLVLPIHHSATFPAFSSALIRSIFSLIIFPKVLSSSSTLFSVATDLSANASKHMFFIWDCIKTESLRLLAQCSRRFSVKFPIHPKLMAK